MKLGEDVSHRVLLCFRARAVSLGSLRVGSGPRSACSVFIVFGTQWVLGVELYPHKGVLKS